MVMLITLDAFSDPNKREMALEDMHPDIVAFCEKFNLDMSSSLTPQFHEVFDNFSDIEQIRGSVSRFQLDVFSYSISHDAKIEF